MNTDYTIDSIKHHLNDAFVIRRELVNNSTAGGTIDGTLTTSIDTTLGPCLKVVGNKVKQTRKGVKSRVKRNVERKIMIRSKRPSTNGWRLSDTEFNRLHNIYKFTVEDVVTLWACTVTRGYPSILKRILY